MSDLKNISTKGKREIKSLLKGMRKGTNSSKSA